ncbi:hypothetical protein [uncultured Muribaculum sp.]|jgi:phosphopantetheinyl transferase|uniref:4'-phosphopantetheinyl transferase family protein n=1 Tax=uncultured Muribaculum sp. TaxID=1918613 RepID=UPI0025AEDEEB|nr:hypothetical protein [uncultured Muribaculum sp.]
MKVFEISGIMVGVDTYTPAEKQLKRNDCERMAVLRVLYRLTGFNITDICHNADGSPFLKDMPLNISISHCRTHVAVAVSSLQNNFGIDIENFRIQLNKVKDKFLSKKGQSVWNTENLMLLRAWTIMEATYKAVRIKGIDICNDIVMVPDNDNKMFKNNIETLCGTSHVNGFIHNLSFISMAITPETVVSIVFKS